jgi:uncharacterized membrane protein YgdD (TMEM256/DUF423 family)
MYKKYFISGIIFCLLAVAIGAFGAHGLKSITNDLKLLTVFETGVRYQFFHGLALLIVPFVLEKINQESKAICRLFTIGILLFSFSLYVLVFAKIGGIDLLANIMGPITPIGGVVLIISWLILLFKVFKSKAI